MKKLIIACIVFSPLLASCGPQSSNPREGGLFSYNPDVYEQRLRERRESLTRIKSESNAAEQHNEELEQQALAMQEKQEVVKKKIQAMNRDLDRIETDMINSARKLGTHKQEHRELEKKIAAARELLSAVSDNDQVDIDAREEEARKLRKHLDNLMAEAEALMDL